MVELLPAGFEEVELEGELELAAYTDAAGEARLREAFGDVRSSGVEPGWESAWKDFHRPVRIGPLWVGPPWEGPPADALRVVIDPGRAFGTGAHATTRLCLELLLGQAPGSLLDIGCGSGVLAVAAARLGFAPVVAVDADPVAVDAAQENAARNGVAIETRVLDALVGALPEVSLAVANIALRPVEALGALVRSRRLIVSGYLAADDPKLPGWCRIERRRLGEWAADLYERL